MAFEWSPHPRFRIYTRPASYGLPLRQLLRLRTGRPNPEAALESEICRRFGSAAAACVPMARTGLWLVLREMIRPGQTVVMSPLTIIDVVNMVRLAGGIPLFGDVRRDSCTLDPDIAESLIDGRTGAVLLTHLHGGTAGAGVFRAICRRRSVPLVEDAAQAFGAIEDGRRLGTYGDAGVFSLGFYKNVNAWQGGLVVSPDAGLVERIRRRVSEWRSLSASRLAGISLAGGMTDLATWPPLFSGLTHPLVRRAILRGVPAAVRRLDPESGARRLDAMPPAYLCRMTPAQAELTLRHIPGVDAAAEARIARARRYHEGLAGLDGLVHPPPPERLSQTYSYYAVQCREREALLRFALRRRRDFAAQCLRNCADLPEFAEFRRDCPNARAAARELVLLPTYPRYPLVEVDRNIAVMREFYGRLNHG